MIRPLRRTTGMTHIASFTPSRRMGHALLRALPHQVLLFPNVFR